MPRILVIEGERHFARNRHLPYFLLESRERGLRLAQGGHIGDEITHLHPYGVIRRALGRSHRLPPGGNSAIPAIGHPLQAGEIAEVAIGYTQRIRVGLRPTCRESGNQSRQASK